MKKSDISKFLLPAAIILASASSPALAGNQENLEYASHKETGGFGIGLLIGSILGGPPGAILGAASGAWLGHHDTQRTNKIAVLNTTLLERENRITKLEAERSATEMELTNAIQQLDNLQSTTVTEILRKGLTTTVYFRSDETILPETSTQQLIDLAQVLQNFPQAEIIMEGHADVRGNTEYNQHLSEQRVERVQNLLQQAGIPEERIQCHAFGESKAMAVEGDQENYIFDRRVTLHIGLEQKNIAKR